MRRRLNGVAAAAHSPTRQGQGPSGRAERSTIVAVGEGPFYGVIAAGLGEVAHGASEVSVRDADRTRDFCSLIWPHGGPEAAMGT